jgi:toxin ParE1/3/4
MKEVRLSPAASLELQDAMAWYETKARDLGAELFAEVRHAFDLIAEYPAGWRSAGNGFRRITLDRFPFVLIYAEEEVEIVVYVVAHTSRKPDYWRKRVADEKQP